MADLKPNAQEDKDVEPGADSTGPTQDPVHRHTFSLKNNAAGLSEQLSSDTLPTPLNGAQPKPFVYRSVPAVPHAGNSLPSGALVNGPGSHPTSEESCVLNKGAILPNNVLDTQRQPEKDTGPQVLLPPIELQSDAGKNPAGPVLAALPGANPPPSDTDDSEDAPPYHALPGRRPQQMHIRQILMNKGIRGGSIWDLNTESSESSSDDFDNDADLNWGPQKELIRFLWNSHTVSRSCEDRAGGIRYVSQRQQKHKVHMPEHTDKVYNGCIDANEDTHIDDDGDDDDDNDDKFDSVVTRVSEDSCNEDFRVDKLITKPKTEERSEAETPFFPRTKRSVTSKERRHLHRHMMYHLDGHNQVHRENVPRPFICRECGRSFRAHNSLLKHMTIHQQRREKLMEEIKGLRKPPDEAKLQCPQCVFRTNCPNTFVEHAKSHEREKRYFRCGECNHASLTERELEAHLHKVHFGTHQPKYMRIIKDEEETISLFHCNACSFSTQNENVLKRHSELIHQRLSDDEYESPQINKVSVHTESMCSQYKLTDQPKKANIKPLALKPKFCIKTPAFWKRADLPYWSSNKANFYMSNTDRQKSYKGLNPSQLKYSLGSTTNKLSQSLQWSDKRSKLSLRPMEKIDVTTGLPYVEEDNYEYDQIVSENSERTKYPSNIDVLLTTKAGKSDGRSQMFCHGYDSDHSHGGSDLTSRKVEAILQKSPSKRKMSTPLRNTIDRMVDSVLPKLHQRLKGYPAPDDTEGDDEDTYDFSDYTSEATANFLDSSENKKNPYARSYFIRRQRALVTEGSVPAEHHYDTEDANNSDVQHLFIKEECSESAVCDESPTDPRSDPALPALGTEKSCPYCPAIFESGVGLSNHVRGHLHRVGLSYDARHMVSPEQVASQDRQPRIRRKIPSASHRVKKADKPELQGEHTCPLCWGWFDTKTGLSNHVRGHLKRIGKTITSTSKSPLCILNELLQDEKEHQHILQLLSRKQVLARPFVSQKFIGSDGLFLMPTGIPVKIQHGVQANPPWRPASSRQEGEELSEKKRTDIETQGVTKPPSSTLVELLKRRKDKELEARDSARKHFTVTKDSMEGIQAMSLEPNWAFEGSESNKKICIHCNTIFPSAVSLSNHLRAYARRKAVAMLEGTSYDCKQKKPRLRSALKKKVFPLSNAMEKIYRLTCRFCDLVFQGPLSIQEDWIKHLQRHLMHTGVPHTGTGMVEVLSLHQETPPAPHEEPGLEQHLPPLELPVVS